MASSLPYIEQKMSMMLKCILGNEKQVADLVNFLHVNAIKSAPEKQVTPREMALTSQ